MWRYILAAPAEHYLELQKLENMLSSKEKKTVALEY
jgi:hypothetical protein